MDVFENHHAEFLPSPEPRQLSARLTDMVIGFLAASFVALRGPRAPTSVVAAVPSLHIWANEGPWCCLFQLTLITTIKAYLPNAKLPQSIANLIDVFIIKFSEP